MKVKIFGLVEHEEKFRSEFQAPGVNVTATEAEVDERGGWGLQVGAIDVNRADGKTARFWVTLRRTNKGRIQAEIRANRREDESAKHVTGVWLDYDARSREDA